MRIWNLSTLDELESSVVIKFQQQPTRQTTSGAPGLKARFTVAAAAVGVSAAFLLHYPSVSTPVLSISGAETNIAQSLPRVALPLAALFQGKFTDSWSADDENRALGSMAAQHSKKTAEYDEAEAVSTVLGNLHESFGAEVPRIGEQEIRTIIKRRRSV